MHVDLSHRKQLSKKWFIAPSSMCRILTDINEYDYMVNGVTTFRQKEWFWENEVNVKEDNAIYLVASSLGADGESLMTFMPLYSQW